MTGDANLWMALFALGSLLLAAATFYAGWVVRVNKGESAAEAAKKAQEQVERVERDLNHFKEHVAATYASNSTLEQVEKRIVDAINRMGDRLDRLFHPATPGA